MPPCRCFTKSRSRRCCSAGTASRDPDPSQYPLVTAWHTLIGLGGICAGKTGDLLDLVSDDGTHGLVWLRRGGREPLSEACECPAALPGGQ